MTLVDCKYADLTALGFSGSNSDMIYDWLLSNLGLSGAQGMKGDLWHQYWDSMGIPEGAYGDRAYKWLITMYPTYDPSQINDLWYKFWCEAIASGGTLPWFGGLGGRWPLIPSSVNETPTPDDALDVSGNANHAEILGGADIRNHGVKLNGTDQYINYGDVSILSFGDGVTDNPFSIRVNFKSADYNAGYYSLLSKGVYGGTGEYNIFTGAKTVWCWLSDSVNGGTIGRYSAALPLTSLNGQTIELVLTYDGSGLEAGIKLYLDGVRVDDTSNSAGTYVAMTAGTADILIGKHDTAYCDGNVADVQVFDSELTADQITGVTLLPSPIFDTPLNHRYQFNDISGNNNHGTPIGDPQIIGEAAYFDGTDDYLDAGDRPSLRITDALTICIWGRADADNKIMLSKLNGAGKRNYYADISSQSLQLAVSGDGTVVKLVATVTTVELGELYFSVGTFEPNVIKAFLNGLYEAENTTDIPATIDESDAPLLIGDGVYTGAHGFFEGYLNDARVYNKALTADEIKALYAQGPQSLDPDVLQSWVQAHWPLTTEKLGPELVTGEWDIGSFTSLESDEGRIIRAVASGASNQSMTTRIGESISGMRLKIVFTISGIMENLRVKVAAAQSLNSAMYTSDLITEGTHTLYVDLTDPISYLGFRSASAAADFSTNIVSCRQVLTPESVADNDGEVYGATFSSDGAEFDGVDDYILVPDATEMQDIFDNGGSIEVILDLASMGQSSSGRIVDKGGAVGWTIHVQGTKVIRFAQRAATSAGLFDTPNNSFVYGTPIHLVITYDNQETTNIASTYIDGIPVTVTTVAPVGARLSDVGEDLIIGNNAALDHTTEGAIKGLKFYNRILPPWEVMNKYLQSGV